MKKVLWYENKLIVLILLIVYGVSFGQTYPKDAVELLVGKELKVLPKEYNTEVGYYDFYKNKDYYSIKSKGYYKSIKAKYDVFNGAIFKLISFENIKNSIGKRMLSLELYNDKIGIVYYDYDPNFNLSWIFEVIGGIQYPDNYWCKEIETKTDKFTSITSYNSPINEHVSFIKEKGFTYIYLLSHGKTPTVGGTGVIILLDDGSKIENKEAKIDVKYAGDGYYDYSTLFSLKDDEIKKLSETQITDYRLFIYEFKIDKEKGWFFKEYLKCLNKM
jgi:hypothetical protein